MNESSMNEPSQEQSVIINSLNNVIVDASPGSGKTTTILNIAKKYSPQKVLQITYNSMLKLELRKKVKLCGLKNLEIQTYHSLAVNYYDNSGFTDEHLKKILFENVPLKKDNIEKIDILLIDEAQDMTPDYYKLLCKFLKDIKQMPRLMLFGDYQQCIYKYKNASHQFLTMGHKIWNVDFDTFPLTTSFRLTNQISFFINNCMIHKNKIKTIRDNSKVELYITNPYTVHLKIGKKILQYLTDGYTPDDIFVLVPSVKMDSTPFKKLENYLVKNNIPCVTPSSDTAKLDESLINKKVVFTTFHQSKGRERKIVIVYNFDMSYFHFFEKTASPSVCPNVLYVACSRAIDKLILIQDEKMEQLKFLNLIVPNIDEYVNIIKTSKKKSIIQKQIQNATFMKKSVSDIVRFISEETTTELLKLCQDIFKVIVEKNIEINIPNKIQTSENVFEDVSNLNGLVIPAIYEKLHSKSKMSSLEYYVLEHCEHHPEIRKYVKNIKNPSVTTEDHLKIGNLYVAIQNKLHSKVAQIKNYNWLTEQHIQNCLKNMEFLNNSELLYEYKITNTDTPAEEFFIYEHPIYGIVKISSRIDAFDKENIYEFKCVSIITLEHKLQLIFYYWLWKNSILQINYGSRNAVLINIQNGQVLQLLPDMYKINMIIDLIIVDKMTYTSELNDEDFVKMVSLIKI